MNNYLLSSTCGDRGYINASLEEIITFPVQLTTEELWNKVEKKIRKGDRKYFMEAAYYLHDWTGMKRNNRNVAEYGEYVISTHGGTSFEPGDFVGYVRGEVISSGGLACLWGDSGDPDAEFTSVNGGGRKAVFAVCRTKRGGFWLHEVHDEGHLQLAEALGVSFEDLLIA